MDEVAYDDFAKLELKIGRIESAEMVPGATKLVKLGVDLGAEKRTLVAGIAETYPPESLPGKMIVVLANLKPRTIRGVESKGMLLAADVEGKAVLLTVDREAPMGAIVK